MKILRDTKVIIALLLLLLGGGFGVYKVRAKRAPKKELEFTEAKREDFRQVVAASGQVEADKEIELRFQTSGRLAWVGVEEGDRVDQWQALASLDKRELKKKLKKDLNDYMSERWDFEQTHDDYEGEVLTNEIRRILDKAQFDLSNKVIDVELTDLALKYATLVSPIDGIVTEMKTSVAGVNITPARAAITIADPASAIFAMKVDEADITQIETGQTVTIDLDAYPEQKFSGQVEKISFDSAGDSGGTTYRVRVGLPDNGDLRFRLRMNGEGEITTHQEENVLVIPEEAVARRGEDYFVFVAREGQLDKTKVKLGLWGDDEMVVLEGLQEGDKILSSGLSKVKDGQRI